MKRYLTFALALAVTVTALAGCSGSSEQAEQESSAEQEASEPVEEENDEQSSYTYTYSTEDLELGAVEVYDFGDIKLHAYKTNDLMDDECYLVESDSELVVIEAPCFYDTISEFSDYIQSLGKPLNNALLAYHPNGGENLMDINSDINYIATEGADAARQEGGSVILAAEGFQESFGDIYDGTVPQATEIVEPGSITLGGIEFVITEGNDGYDIEIPEINCVFTHMVGSDVHNIMPSIEAMDSLAEQMQSFIDKDYTLILTSHHVPETIEAAETKLAYIEKVKELAESNTNAEDFIAAVNAEFPDYSGEGFLEATAAGLYE